MHVIQLILNINVAAKKDYMIKCYGGIHFTGVTTRCSIYLCWIIRVFLRLNNDLQHKREEPHRITRYSVYTSKVETAANVFLIDGWVMLMFSLHDIFGLGAINFVICKRDSGENLNSIILDPAIKLGLD